MTRTHTPRLIVAGLALLAMVATVQAEPFTDLLTFGAITDLHHADRPDTSRYYSAALNKMEMFSNTMNGEAIDFAIELGDFKDEAQPPTRESTIQYLQEVEAKFQIFNGPTYHVLGNHDVDSISKSDFQANVTNTGIAPADTYYSFDYNNVHCVVLDACFTQAGVAYDSGNFNWTDTKIPDAELNWLQADLAATTDPTLFFVHQTLDRADSDSLNVKNGSAVRSMLEADGDVLAVFQGHHHAGGLSNINGIHYLTLEGSVDGGTDPLHDNAFSKITLSQSTTDASMYQIDLVGYGRQDSRQLSIGGTPPAPTPAALLAYYPFDTTTNLTDASGNGHDGVGMHRDSTDASDPTFGDPTVDTSDKKLGDASLRLQEAGNLAPYTSTSDVSGQWVDLSSTLTELSTGDDVSFSLWFKTSGPSYGGSYDWNDLLFGCNAPNGSANLFRLGIEPGSGQLWVEGGGDTNEGGFNNQQWHHVVLVTDGQSGELKLYVDGEMLTGVGSKVMDWDAADHLSIGMETDGSGPGDFIDGWIDDVSIWTGKLTAEDVAFLYNDGAGNAIPEPASLLLLGMGVFAIARGRRA